MEYGRKPDGTADFSMNLVESERRSTESLDGDFTSGITPDGKSHFKESGVLEGDCSCAMREDTSSASATSRSIQNYRWAATAGADIGRISGAVFQFSDLDAPPGSKEFLGGTWNFSDRPKVAYEWDNRNLSTATGK
jgi:hypothetical protein